MASNTRTRSATRSTAAGRSGGGGVSGAATSTASLSRTAAKTVTRSAAVKAASASPLPTSSPVADDALTELVVPAASGSSDDSVWLGLNTTMLAIAGVGCIVAVSAVVAFVVAVRSKRRDDKAGDKLPQASQSGWGDEAPLAPHWTDSHQKRAHKAGSKDWEQQEQPHPSPSPSPSLSLSPSQSPPSPRLGCDGKVSCDSNPGDEEQGSKVSSTPPSVPVRSVSPRHEHRTPADPQSVRPQASSQQLQPRQRLLEQQQQQLQELHKQQKLLQRQLEKQQRELEQQRHVQQAQATAAARQLELLGHHRTHRKQQRQKQHHDQAADDGSVSRSHTMGHATGVWHHGVAEVRSLSLRRL